MRRDGPRGVAVLLAALAFIVTSGAASAQTVRLPPNPQLPPPEAPPAAPAPTPARPAPAPVAPATPPAPRTAAPTPAAPQSAPQTTGPTAAQRAAAQRAAAQRAKAQRAKAQRAKARRAAARRAAAQRRRETVLRRRASDAIRAALTPLQASVNRATVLASAETSDAPTRNRLPLLAGAALATTLAALVAVLALRRRRANEPRAPDRRGTLPVPSGGAHRRPGSPGSRERRLLVAFGTTAASLADRATALGRRVTPGPLRLARHDAARSGALIMLVVIGSALAGWLLSYPGGSRLAIVGVMLAAVAGLGAMSARLLVPALMVWLAALGLMRRLLTELVEPTTFDLLLLVGPSVVIALLIGTSTVRGPASRSRLTRLVAVLAVLAIVAAVNPLNGAPVAGIGSLLFVLIPLLAYWIGVRIHDTTLMDSLLIVGALSVVAAAYGLYQSFEGFPSWDRHWIETSGYAALNVGGEIRSFSSFSSASEYAAYTAVGLTIVCAFLFRRGRFLPMMLPLIALLGTALFLASSRGVVFKMVAALGLMLAARIGMRFSAAVAVALALVLLLPPAVSKIAPENSGNPVIAHQVGGLANPTSQETSTLDIHASIVADALGQAVRNPLGSGLSKVTIAGGRLGGGSTEVGGGVAGAETDIESSAIAMGIPGLLVFLAVLGLGFSRLFGLARDEPGFLPLAGLGILTVTALQWLNGGQYAVGILPWLILGWAEARHLTRSAQMSAGAEGREPEGPVPAYREPLSVS